jgi:preprotein translocase subunit SecE
MAVSPAKFAKQVRQEASRVTWPSRRETGVSFLMVLLMVAVASVFFLVIDWIISGAVQTILGF